MKPQAKGAILHRSAQQPWPADGVATVEDVRRGVRERLGFDADPRFADAGDYWFVCDVGEDDLDAARAFAVVLSRRLPGVWLVLDRLFVRDGRFFRRERGFKLNLTEASNVHLPRETRAALKGMI